MLQLLHKKSIDLHLFILVMNERIKIGSEYLDVFMYIEQYGTIQGWKGVHYHLYFYCVLFDCYEGFELTDCKIFKINKKKSPLKNLRYLWSKYSASENIATPKEE